MENIANPALDPFLSLPRRLALRLMRYLTKDDRTRLVFVDERDGLRSFHDDGAGDLTKSERSGSAVLSKYRVGTIPC